MFKLEITTIEDFSLFVRIIKGEDVNDDEIKKLTKTLNFTTDRLEEAEKGAENAGTGS